MSQLSNVSGNVLNNILSLHSYPQACDYSKYALSKMEVSSKVNKGAEFWVTDAYIVIQHLWQRPEFLTDPLQYEAHSIVHCMKVAPP